MDPIARYRDHVVTMPRLNLTPGRKTRSVCSCGWASDHVERHWALKQAERHLDDLRAAADQP